MARLRSMTQPRWACQIGGAPIRIPGASHHKKRGPAGPLSIALQLRNRNDGGEGAGQASLENALSQIAAKSLDALAGLFEIGGLGGVGDPERGPKSERGSLHHGNALVLQKLGDEILVIADQLAGRRGLADSAGAGR